MTPTGYSELPATPAGAASGSIEVVVQGAPDPANTVVNRITTGVTTSPAELVVKRSEPTWLERDLAAARAVQRGLLPPLEQQWRGVDMVAEYRPAHQVGGDFFEVTTHPTGQLTAVVGDVAGKGVAAALIMARVSGEIRRVTRRSLRPRRILARMNRWLDQQDLGDRFVTACCVTLDLPRAVWTIASAGHPAALLFRRNGTMLVLGEEGGPGLGLGCVECWRCDEHEIPAQPGDTLLLMTDGLTDRLDPQDIAAAVGHATTDSLSLHDLKRDLFDRISAMPGPRDDATLLTLRLGTALPPSC